MAKEIGRLDEAAGHSAIYVQQIDEMRMGRNRIVDLATWVGRD